MGERLTRATVVDRATALIERDGAASFSLRRLAVDLGVRPSALYNHVGSREDLLTAVANGVIARLPIPDDGAGPWREWLRGVAVALRAALLDRPELAALVLARGGSTDAGPTLLGRVMSRLEAAGVDRPNAHLAWHLVLTTVIGSVQQDLTRRAPDEGMFEAVVDLALDGVALAAERPTTPAARRLLTAHRLDDGRPTAHHG